MTPAYLHEKLIEACENGNFKDVQHYLDAGADPNLNIKKPSNALDKALTIQHEEIVKLLLKHGAIVKEFVLQKAIEKDKSYLKILIPDFETCSDQKLLMGVLQAAINRNDFTLAKEAINQGAKPQSLLLHAILNLESREILQLLIENGLDIHAEKNMVLSEWLGSSEISGWNTWKAAKDDLLSFIFEYYLDKPNEIEKFKSLRLSDKRRLFKIGLDKNDYNMMKFSLLIGANKNEALNSALYRYYANNKKEKINFDIIEYILNSEIIFEKVTISNAICFQYTELLNALNSSSDLEYGYEMAYFYANNTLCDYFIDKGVSYKAQLFSKMKISAIKGDLKELAQAINEGANIKELHTDIIIEILNNNQLKTLKYLSDSGFVFDSSLNQHLNQAINSHNAYDAVSYLIEQGFDITFLKHMPRPYKKRYPLIADMWEKRFSDIFDYTTYLATKVYPNLKGKEKEEILAKIAQLSSLSYVIKKSEEKLRE